MVRALAAAVAGRGPGCRPRRPGDRRPHCLRRIPQRQADHRHRRLRRLRPRSGARLRRRRPRWPGLELLVRPGPVDPVADGGVGDVWGDGCGAGARRPQRRSLQPRRGLRSCRHRLRCAFELLADGYLRWRSLARALPDPGGTGDPVRRRPRRRQRRLCPARRPGDGADAGPLPRALRVARHAGGRDGDPGRPAASQSDSGNGQGCQHRSGSELARSGAERGRRLRFLAQQRLQRRAHRLGDAGLGGRRAQSL